MQITQLKTRPGTVCAKEMDLNGPIQFGGESLLPREILSDGETETAVAVSVSPSGLAGGVTLLVA